MNSRKRQWLCAKKGQNIDNTEAVKQEYEPGNAEECNEIHSAVDSECDT
jgi:hypothetical protein